MNLRKLLSATVFLGLMASAHALTWTQPPLPRDGHLTNLAFGAQKFLATVDTGGYYGGNTKLASTTSGSSWSLSSAPIPFDCLASSGSNHFIGADWKSGYFSSNGTSWSKLTAISSMDGIDDLFFSGGKYVIFGSKNLQVDPWWANVLIYSTNATFTTWTQKTLTLDGNLQAGGYGLNLFVAAARTSGTTAFYSSPDGATWTKRTVVGDSLFSRIRFLNGRFIAVGTAGSIYISLNGTVWTKATTPSSDTLYDVAFGKSTLVAVGTAGAIYVSINNGTSWTVSPSGIWSCLNGVVFSPTLNKFLVTGPNEAVLLSD